MGRATHVTEGEPTLASCPLASSLHQARRPPWAPTLSRALEPQQAGGRGRRVFEFATGLVSAELQASRGSTAGLGLGTKTSRLAGSLCPGRLPLHPSGLPGDPHPPSLAAHPRAPPSHLAVAGLRGAILRVRGNFRLLLLLHCHGLHCQQSLQGEHEAWGLSLHGPRAADPSWARGRGPSLG